MSDLIKEKETETETVTFPIMPVGKSYRAPSSNIGVNEGSGNTRVSPESRSEEGTLMRCMTCSYKSPTQSFMSDNNLVFNGCPECGEIDRSKMVYIDEDGIKLPNESNIRPKDFSDYIDSNPKNYGKPKPVEHQLRQNII